MKTNEQIKFYNTKSCLDIAQVNLSSLIWELNSSPKANDVFVEDLEKILHHIDKACTLLLTKAVVYKQDPGPYIKPITKRRS